MTTRSWRWPIGILALALLPSSIGCDAAAPAPVAAATISRDQPHDGDIDCYFSPNCMLSRRQLGAEKGPIL